jgi:tagaturonate epimerase
VTLLDSLRGLAVRPGSRVSFDRMELAAIDSPAGEQQLAVMASNAASLVDFEGATSEHGDGVLLVGPRSTRNIEALRKRLEWLRPRTLGLATSAGFGDRLGLATPGHIRALRAVAEGGIVPIFAQQSIREMDRSHRTPRAVVDDATWGVFAEGWWLGFGSDADHLKTLADVERCLPMGYTFWTIDPGDEVNVAAETASADTLRRAFESDVPWQSLEDTPAAYLNRYVGRSFAGGLTMDEVSAGRAAVKYGSAIARTARLYRLLRERLGPNGWEMEVAIDETEPVTSHLEHICMILELQRLEVQFVSYAPRYFGEFEKGVDFLGDMAEFERSLALHAAIARQLGPYKLSLHSGSDKFSIYDLSARATQGLVHLKTAGTSFVEALRTLAEAEPAFFRSVYAFARETFPIARVGYHISGQVERTPSPDSVSDADLPELLDAFDSRQVLHVTYGQVLSDAALREKLLALLRRHQDAYSMTLERHFIRHLKPFCKPVPKSVILSEAKDPPPACRSQDADSSPSAQNDVRGDNQ